MPTIAKFFQLGRVKGGEGIEEEETGFTAMRMNSADQKVPAKAQRVHSHACCSLLCQDPDAARLHMVVSHTARQAGGAKVSSCPIEMRVSRGAVVPQGRPWDIETGARGTGETYR